MMERPRIAVRAIFVDDEDILLAKYEDDRGFWYVAPGGGVEKGETLEEAFHREIHEETGTRTRFGEVLFIREIIADRQPETHLAPGFHQVEINVRSELSRSTALATLTADPNQVGLEWVPLAKLGEILFFPRGLTAQFQRQRWEEFYYGDVR